MDIQRISLFLILGFLAAGPSYTSQSTTEEPTPAPTPAPTTTPTPTTLPDFWCYGCDSRLAGYEACADDWNVEDLSQYDDWRVACATGYCIKEDFIEKNTTKNKDLDERLSGKDRKITRIVRHCATSSDIDNIPNNEDNFFNNRKGGCNDNEKLYDSRKVQQCFCTVSGCNHGNSLALDAILSLSVVIAAIMCSRR